MAVGDVRFDGGNVGVLMIHGLGGTPVEVRYIAQSLNRAGYTVECPLLKGHGGSDLLLSTTRWTDWVESAERAYQRLKASCDRVIIAGQSAGAMISLHLAARHGDEIEGLVLYSPTFWPNGWAIPKHFNLFRLVRHRWFANLFHFRERQPYGIKDERLRKYVIDSLQADERDLDDIFGRRGGTVLEFRRLADAAKRQLSQVTCPTIVFHSREDDQAGVSNALRLARDIKGRTDLVLLNDSYHLVTLDRERGVVAERTIAFANALTEKPARAARRTVGQQATDTMQAATSA